MILYTVDISFEIPEGEIPYTEFQNRLGKAIDELSEKANRHVDIDDVSIEVRNYEVNVYYNVEA